MLALSLPLISINMEQKTIRTSRWFDQPLSYFSSSALEFFYSFSAGVTETTGLYLNLIDIKKQNLLLNTQNGELQTRIQESAELALENERLRGLLTFKEKSKMTLIASKVIGRDPVADHNTVTINKGTKDGIKAGMAVMNTEGAVGYIYKPEPFTSHVMLITDRYAVVDAVIQRTRAHGIVEGRGKNQLQLQYVDRTDEVQPGDLVVTGGLDNIFPKGFPLATVTNVQRKTKSVTLIVDLKPVVDPLTVEEVFVVLEAAHEDMSPTETVVK